MEEMQMCTYVQINLYLWIYLYMSEELAQCIHTVGRAKSNSSMCNAWHWSNSWPAGKSATRRLRSYVTLFSMPEFEEFRGDPTNGTYLRGLEAIYVLPKNITIERNAKYRFLVSRYVLKHRWSIPLAHLQTDNLCLFFRQQTEKRQTSVCTMSKQ